MAESESKIDYQFLLVSCNRDNQGGLIDEVYVVNKLEGIVKDPITEGKFLKGRFAKTEKEALEELLKKVQSPGFKS